MSKILTDSENYSNIAKAIQTKLNVSTTYKPSEMAAAIQSIQTSHFVADALHVTQNGTYMPEEGIDGYSLVTVQVENDDAAVLEPLSVTQNGTYNPGAGVDGFDQVEVNVSGGGGGPVYSGVTAPDASLGSNEDLYIQYKVMPSQADHTYLIAAAYRKVNGLWESYTAPIIGTEGFHVWTKSTGGYDAAMYVQVGYWDVDNDIFVATGEVETILYTTVRTWATAKNCNDVALLAYPSNWQIKATTTITDGTIVYQTDDIAATWSYNTSVDRYFWHLQD